MQESRSMPPGSIELYAQRTSSKEALRPIDRHFSLGELAYISLKEALLRGQFRAGQKLTVRGIAEGLGTSTSPARDAIMRLIEEGALANAGPKTIVVPALTLATLDEVTSIRLALEPLAASIATERIAGDTVERLKRLNSQIFNGTNHCAMLMADKAFHFCVYESAQMPRMAAMIESLWMRIAPSLNELSATLVDQESGAANHMQTIIGLQDRNKALVQAAINKDIRDGYQQLVGRLKQLRAATGELKGVEESAL